MILDLGLPDTDGLALLQRLRTDSDVKAPLHVVVHTGRSLTKQETRQLEEYAAEVVLKEERSGDRLVDEVRLFLRHLEDGLTEKGVAQTSEPDSSVGAVLRGKRVLLPRINRFR
jgi:DNA-binding response OmpR family regulator